MTFDEFKNIDLRVGRVLAAERVPDSEKLIKLEVDLGGDSADGSGLGKRQIVAGIGKKYEPESLLQREIVIVVNLDPRKLMGLESQGMLLAAHDENGEPIILTVDKEAPPGSKIS